MSPFGQQPTSTANYGCKICMSFLEGYRGPLLRITSRGGKCRAQEGSRNRMFDLTVRALTTERMPLLYRMAQLAMPDLSLSAWHEFASARIARNRVDPGGIFVAEDRNRHVLGFASYLISDHPRHVRILMADSLFAPGIIERQSETVLILLLEAMENLARVHHCNAIHIQLEALETKTSTPHTHRILGTAGYSRESLAHCKPLEPAF